MIKDMYHAHVPLTSVKEIYPEIIRLIVEGPFNITTYEVWKFIIDGKLEYASRHYRSEFSKLPYENRKVLGNILKSLGEDV